jgi:hypothetical protein
VVKLSRPRFRRWDRTSYGCDRQKKGRPGDLRDTMIAGIALAQHATLATRNTAYCEGGVQIEASEDWSTGTRAKNQRVLHSLNINSITASCGVGWSDGYWTMSEKYAITAHLDWDTDKTDEENIAAATGGRGQLGASVPR